jgi:Spy/CpxP family protein refolding chaperone
VGRGVVNTAEMARPIFWAFVGLLAFGVPAGAAELCDSAQQRAAQTQQGKDDKDKKDDKGQQPQRRHWWSDPKLRTELGISDQQSAVVEQIWQRELPKLRETRDKLAKLEEELTRLTGDRNADEAAVIAKIDAVETVRADGNKRRTAMIYRMHKVLTPDQRAKVKAMFEPKDPPKRSPATSR